MRRRAIVATALSCWLVLMLDPHAAALNEPSHEIINEVASRYEELDKLLRSLGLSDGIEEPIAGLRVFRRIREGGTREDEGSIFNGTARFLRHFHDPLQPWGEAGLDLGVARYDSSIRWMQRPNQQAEARGTGNWSWSDARRYFRDALAAPNSGTREEAWADTFRALGQIMHLVVDTSVPEHVRNDAHPLGFLYGNYEYWVQGGHTGPKANKDGFIRDYLSRLKTFDATILQQPTGDGAARVPIARLIDTDRYTGQDPSVTVGETIGIAEVANANFFSEDTHEGEYPFPSVALLQRSRHPAPLTGVARAYYKKGVGDGFQVDPVLAECVLDRAGAGPPSGPTFKCTDENVWSATASEMLPRAVGYARGVLGYFFRGKLSAALRVYKENDQFHAEVRITNRTPDEDMLGTFEIYYDLPDGTRKWMKGWDLALGPASSAIAQSELLTISPLPTDTPPTAWTLVFKGRLGAEEGAVAATRMGSRYVGSVTSYTTSISGGSAISVFRDASSYEPEPPFLIARDRITLTAWGGPVGGIQGVTDRLRESYVYYPDPTSTRNRVEIVASPWSICGGYDDVWYGLNSYRDLFNHFEWTPTTPSAAALVEFEPPDALAELFGYEERPPVLRILIPAIGPGITAGPIDIAGVRMLGLVLTSAPTEPPVPEIYPEGYPRATSLRECVARVDLHPVD